MTKFSKHIAECSERASKISEEEDQNDDVGKEEGEEREEELSGEVLESRIVTDTMSTNKRIQRYLVAVEYIGTKFSGSQKQLNCRTVVGVLEEAFHKFIGQPVSISLSSRTDAGVHAASNVCHVDIERISKRKPGEVLPPHDSTVVRRAVNHFLQKSEGDIMVTDVRCVPSDFHARFRAQERMYLYRIFSGPEPFSVFEKDRAWHVTAEELDLHAMQEACKVLIGRHDFSSFRASGCQASSPIRTLDELHVSEVVSTTLFPSVMERDLNIIINQDSPVHCIKSGPNLVISSIANKSNLQMHEGGCNIFGLRKKHRCYEVRARARSFLYHQVRLIVGVLKAVGTGEITIFDVKRILEAKTVTAACPMAPAHGLYLGFVKYDLPDDDKQNTVETSESSPDQVSRKRRLQ